ncbi:hypothetical protein BJX63DRAFT_207495 [Aspergillus granulosus]|uniref:Uncharacterized protein n=1 Tax=Aspergillus granulosus TaxID=176169 RepID=A0ABR4HF50_9EURO
MPSPAWQRLCWNYWTGAWDSAPEHGELNGAEKSGGKNAQQWGWTLDSGWTPEKFNTGAVSRLRSWTLSFPCPSSPSPLYQHPNFLTGKNRKEESFFFFSNSSSSSFSSLFSPSQVVVSRPIPPLRSWCYLYRLRHLIFWELVLGSCFLLLSQLFPVQRPHLPKFS